jgi:hypothetical protein
MRTPKIKLTSLALVCALFGAAACDDSTDSTGDDNTGGTVSRAGSGGKGGKGGAGGEGGKDAADAGEKDASSEEGGKGGSSSDAGSDSGSGDDSCFKGEPKETVQFLNQCTDSECEPFDNAERLPLLEADGKLPPLP